MYTGSAIWEELFIEVSGHDLRRPITIGNIIYRPHNNKNNVNIETFIEEFSPIIYAFLKENRYAAIVDDFNINILQINEKAKFGWVFFSIWCIQTTFFPKITFLPAA